MRPNDPSRSRCPSAPLRAGRRATRLSAARLAAWWVLAAGVAVLLPWAGAQPDDQTTTAPAATQPVGDAPPLWSVAAVVDERTLRLTGDGGELELRLLGAAEPPARSDRAAARVWLENLLRGEQVIVSDLTQPGAGPRAPTYGYVHRAPDRLFVNLEMVRQGYAPAASKPAHDQADLFEAAELRARHVGKGIWRPPSEKPPPESDRPRANVRPARERSAVPVEEAPPKPAAPQSAPTETTEDTLVFITASGEKYHLATCRFATNARALPLSAARKSHEPCSVCKPPK